MTFTSPESLDMPLTQPGIQPNIPGCSFLNYEPLDSWYVLLNLGNQGRTPNAFNFCLLRLENLTLMKYCRNSRCFLAVFHEWLLITVKSQHRSPSGKQINQNFWSFQIWLSKEKLFQKENPNSTPGPAKPSSLTITQLKIPFQNF